MIAPKSMGADVPARDLLFVTTPALWPAWPFLPVIRHTRGAEALGLMFDARGAAGRSGYDLTVFLGNLFDLPAGLDAFLALPRETFETTYALLAAGWRVD